MTRNLERILSMSGSLADSFHSAPGLRANYQS